MKQAGLFLLVLLLGLTGCRGGIKTDIEPYEAAPLPRAQRAAGRLIVVDIGHGGFDGGAVGIDTGVAEAGLNLQVGLLVEALLKEEGAKVILTRSDGEALGETKQADMHRRGEILKTADADAVVSIHMNKFTDRKVKGPMAYYQAGEAEGEKLAGCVINALTKALDKPERQPNPGNNFVTRVPAAPAVLVECGFLSNPEEELLLQQEAYQKILAQAIVEGLLAYFAEEKDA